MSGVELLPLFFLFSFCCFIAVAFVVAVAMEDAGFCSRSVN